jgi:hypothetical protein
MTTPVFRASFSQALWIVWCLLVTLMLMFLGGVSGVMSAMAFMPHPSSSIFPTIASLLLIGLGLGVAVGGFRGLWAQREIGDPHFQRWIAVNSSLSSLGLPMFIGLVSIWPGYHNDIDPLAGLVLGLCYGVAFGSIAVLGEWLAIRKYRQALRRWFGVGWIGWVIWWTWVGYVLSIVSQMD